MIPSKLKTAKRSVSTIVVHHVFAGRYARLRIPRTAMRYSEAQLAKIFRGRRYFPPIMIGENGEVLAGFAQAQWANRSILGRHVCTVKYSEMTVRYMRDYIKWIKKTARRGKWENQILGVELQNLQKTH